MEYSRPDFLQALTAYDRPHKQTAIIFAFIPNAITHKHRIVGEEGGIVIEAGWQVFVHRLPSSAMWTRWGWSRYLIVTQLAQPALMKILEECFTVDSIRDYWRVGFSFPEAETSDLDLVKALDTLEWKSVKLVQRYVLDSFFHVMLYES